MVLFIRIDCKHILFLALLCPQRVVFLVEQIEVAVVVGFPVKWEIVENSTSEDVFEEVDLVGCLFIQPEVHEDLHNLGSEEFPREVGGVQYFPHCYIRVGFDQNFERNYFDKLHFFHQLIRCYSRVEHGYLLFVALNILFQHHVFVLDEKFDLTLLVFDEIYVVAAD